MYVKLSMSEIGEEKKYKSGNGVSLFRNREEGGTNRGARRG
jgi:hypothetical protein